MLVKWLAFDRAMRYLIGQGGWDSIHVTRSDPISRLFPLSFRVFNQNDGPAPISPRFRRVHLLSR